MKNTKCIFYNKKLDVCQFTDVNLKCNYPKNAEECEFSINKKLS